MALSAKVGNSQTPVAFQNRASMRAERARFMVGLFIGLLASALSAPAVEARPLSLEERVEAQRAIERVYWNHRIWPKENPGPKPRLSTVLPDAALRARVKDTLRKSNALKKYWHRAITAQQLQAELNRMAAHTRDPQALRELFAALGNDPFLIAETLARQTLTDRLIRNWYENDTRFHGELKKHAEAAVAACRDVGCMKSLGGEYRETTWRLRDDRAGAPLLEPAPDLVPLDREAWQAHRSRLAAAFGRTPDTLPILKMSGLEETEVAFVVTTVLSQGKDVVRTATVTWPKVSFDAWWSVERSALAVQVEDSPSGFNLPAVASSGCVVDTWDSMMGLNGRYGHTAVWTGTEMIVWGGVDNFFSSTGGRYDPATDTFAPISDAAHVSLSWRSAHSAVWTGTEMIVWGGAGGINFNTGGRYDPAADSWMPTSTGMNVPAARSGHSAVWTGTKMIVWGGSDGIEFNTGGRYDPSTDNWAPTSTGVNVPAARSNHAAVWTGTEMIVWGGRQNSASWNTGGRYDPSTDSWTPTSTGANVPAGRHRHKSIWTGTEMIVWGGTDGLTPLDSGGRYDPASDTWEPTSAGANVPAARSDHTVVWTGEEMIVWGGFNGIHLNSGGRYDPSADSWAPTSIGANVPTVRGLHTTVWTGTELIVWGGYNGAYALNTGGRYDPSTDTWIPTWASPVGRSGHTAVWTGAEMITWGGNNTAIGSRYNPSLDAWTPTSTGANSPVGRELHTAVWTGREMIVWGGLINTSGVELNTGARYNLFTDTWTLTSTGANVPAGRYSHSVVWTGSEMIVWGGFINAGGVELNTGARYNPFTDAWTPTSTGANVPAGRYSHTAVWTGSDMIIWGGWTDGCYLCVNLNSGGRYDPSTDTWTPTSTGMNVPAPRASHTAAWTGTGMIVWGGISSCALDELGIIYCTRDSTGGRYDPSTDTWTPTSTGPSARSGHTAVWTGTEMIVWGGADASCSYTCCGDPCDPLSLCLSCNDVQVQTGGLYDPSTDTWTPTSTGADVPVARSNHGAVWTGAEMILWGGGNFYGTPLDDGGLYCACPDGTLYYQDSDGDGYGDAATVGTSCDGTIPAGHAANQSDCNDASATVNPGAAELCNALDDNCDGAVDNAIPPGTLTSVSVRGDVPSVEWDALATAQIYDVVFGDLGLLRTSGGDFTTATQGCVVAGTVSTSAIFGTVPEVGQGFWVLVRGDNCAGVGTYDSGGPGQAGSRDAEINVSPFSCGYQAVCGDASCSATEDCITCPSDCGSCECASDSECQPADCCHPTSCITIWEPQSCNSPTCDGGCWFCISSCACQNGACIAVF